MKKRLSGLTTAMLTVMTLLMLSSCRHKDLYMEESMTSQLVVVFDWRDAPEANPASMALYLYENDGHSPLRFIFNNRDGGLIKVPFGTRHALYMNGDNTDWVHIRGNENIESMELYTSEAEALDGQGITTSSIPRAREAESEKLVRTPQMLWGSRTNEIHVLPHEGTDTITLYPHEAVCHYMVDIYDVENISGVSSATVDATISGMADGYSLGQTSATDNPVTMTFSLTADAEHESLHGEFLTFGECVNTKKTHMLTVYMVLADGSKWWHSFDVTAQVANAPDPTHVHIIIRGLPLPEPPSQGQSDLTTDVNEWQPINIGLKM